MPEAIQQQEEQQSVESSDSFRKGYASIANPEQVEVEKKTEVKPESEQTEIKTEVEQQAAETPPEKDQSQVEKEDKQDELAELRAQASRIPDLQKQLMDVNGRYGRLAQKVDGVLQKLSAPPDKGGTNDKSVDAESLLAEMKDQFPELAESLSPAFKKLLEARSGVDGDTVTKTVTESLTTAEKKRRDEAIEALTEEHPDWMTLRESDEFSTWKAALPKRVQARMDKSEDPFYLADKFDEFKEWAAKKKEEAQATQTNSSKPETKSRLEAAVLPTNGTKPAPRGEPSPSESFRNGYKRIASSRIT